MDMYWGVKKKKKNNNDDDNNDHITADVMINTNKVEIINNRIYYYADVDEDSILGLNKHVQSLLVKAKIHAAQNDMSVMQSGQIFLHIQSFGGSVFSGLSGMDTLLEAREHIPVTTLIDGCAASAATFISVVGSRRVMRRNSYMLIHQLSSGMWGKFEELKDEMENLNMFMDTIRDIYGKYTRVPKKEMNKILKHDMWWNAKKCLEYGMIDEII